MAVTPGAHISRYKVLSVIGSGGMGEVYLAEDTMLGRKVALKLLTEEYIQDGERLRRFEQEARAASALNHPNIITIYEIGRAEQAEFIAMEYIEGETLRAKMKRERLSLLESLGIAVQVAGALAAAHAAGIVHRDIKPENIMARPDGIIKVLDFGIVKLTEQFTEHRPDEPDSSQSRTLSLVRTEPGIVVGSPNYMSPEQARGLEVDARTDIFSLGVVIYEMLAGEKPFKGDTISDVIVSILERDPPALAECAPEVPEQLAAIVMRALVKDKQKRCQSARELLTDLKREKRRLEIEEGLDMSFQPNSTGSASPDTNPASGRTVPSSGASGAVRPTQATSATEPVTTQPGRSARSYLLVALAAIALIAAAALVYFLPRSNTSTIESLAVLPFVNVSNDPNTEYLSDGITETLINNLSQSPRLKVMSRNSVFRYKGADIDASEVGRALGVRAVLLGRIIERGGMLNINVELINTLDNSLIWGEQYNRRLADILAIQEEIAKRISEKLQLRLTGEQQKRMTRRHTENSHAYQLYLQGRFYWNKRTEEGLRRGLEFFKQAVEADPSYALAYAGLADSYALLSEYGTEPPRQMQQLAKAAALRALELDSNLAEPHTSLAAISEYEWNWTEAEQQYKQAIKANPNYATAHHWYGLLLGGLGRPEEALREIWWAQELDPLSLIINTGVGRVLFNARRYDEAEAQLLKAVEMDPSFAEAHFQLAVVYESKGLYDQAIREYERSIELYGDNALGGWKGRSYARAGRRADALRVIQEMEELSKRQRIEPYMIASVYAALGDAEQAFEWLERAYDSHSYYVIWLKVDPVFDGLRSTPRFQDLLTRVGLK